MSSMSFPFRRKTRGGFRVVMILKAPFRGAWRKRRYYSNE
jgi:hypothetical protein